MKKCSVKSLEPHVHHWCMSTTDEVFCQLHASYGFYLFDPSPTPPKQKRKKPKVKVKVSGSGEVSWDAYREPRDRYAYRPGLLPTSPLLVCHADTVMSCLEYIWKQDTATVISSELDDRLGIAILTDAIERGSALANCAMLICDNEEIGQTTASIFVEHALRKNAQWDVRPNWLMEFDRRGTDAVTYDYSNDTWESLLTHCGWEVGNGSFSDISSMEALEVSGVNVGVGYHREHSKQCHACLHDTVRAVARSEMFLRTFGNITMRHEQRGWRGYARKQYGGTSTTSTVKTYNSYDDYYVNGGKASDKVTPSKMLPTLPTIPVDEEFELPSLHDTANGIVVDGEVQCDDCLEWCSDNDVERTNIGYMLCPKCYADYLKRGMV